MLPEPSEEQNQILTALGEDKNILVDSVAGSGKTTTILFLALAFPKKNFVVVTYSKRLKDDCRNKVKENNVKNLEVHSYHSFGLCYYTEPCITDKHLSEIITNNMELKKRCKADVFIFDETQDMTKIYFHFLQKCRRDIGNNQSQIVVLGDQKQCIYDFPQKGADYRYLTLSPQIWDSEKEWISLRLQTSYRITKPMELFVNNVMLGNERMKSVKNSSIPVRYITGDPFTRVPEYILKEIQILMASKNYKPDDFFILAPSVRTSNLRNPIKKLENILVQSGIPCFVPISDDEDLKDEVLNGKIVFSSFHQSKGLERKVVFVASFSMSYYFVHKEHSREICPNPIYVAATRAKECLYLWGEDCEKNVLPFLRKELLSPSHYLEKIDLGINIIYPEKPDRPTIKSLTELTRFMPEDLMGRIVELCKMKTIKLPYTDIKLQSIISTQNDLKEMVSDLTGIAIPTIYEHRLTGKITIQKFLKYSFVRSLNESIKNNKRLNNEKEIREWINYVKDEPTQISEYLRMANIYSSVRSGYLFKIKQIHEYTWLEEENVELLLKNLTDTINIHSETMHFEDEMIDYNGYEWGNIKIQISGVADLVDDTAIWEFKCVDSLLPEHSIQLALYAWLWERINKKEKGSRKYFLHNIRTGETLELTGVENLTNILGLILENVFQEKKNLSDEEFIAKCKSTEIENSPVAKTCLMIDDD